MKITKVKQGDLTDTFKVSPYKKDEVTFSLSSPAGWVCRALILDKVGGNVLFTKDITDKTIDDLYFNVTIEPQETALLNAEEYLWVIEVENLLISPKFRVKESLRLQVEQSVINPKGSTEAVYPINSKEANKALLDLVTIAIPVKFIRFRDDKDKIVQTTGFVSTTVESGSQAIVVLESIISTATKLCVIS